MKPYADVLWLVTGIDKGSDCHAWPMDHRCCRLSLSATTISPPHRRRRCHGCLFLPERPAEQNPLRGHRPFSRRRQQTSQARVQDPSSGQVYPRQASSRIQSHIASFAGSGESGKSTIVKQMKIIHQGGFTKDQLQGYTPIIYRNVVECARSVVIYMRKTGIDCKESHNRVIPNFYSRERFRN